MDRSSNNMHRLLESADGGMTMYLYASHLGGYFGTRKKLENRVCGICGDEDVYIGAARDAMEAKILLSRYVIESLGRAGKRRRRRWNGSFAGAGKKPEGHGAAAESMKTDENKHVARGGKGPKWKSKLCGLY